jgi:ribosomal protein S18 acetylase RimI-like enzyme
MAAPTFRALTDDDVPAAGAVLGRAFADSPNYTAILQHLGDARRPRAVERVMRGFTEAAVHHQRAEGVFDGDTLIAVSLTMAPGQYPIGLGAFARQAVGCVRAGPRALRNFLRADSYMQRHHPKAPHHYLFLLGVEPSRQGQGLGKQLLARLAAIADADALPCFLETDKEQNVRLYQGAGYVVIAEGMVPTRPAFKLWTMRRPARGELNV